MVVHMCLHVCEVNETHTYTQGLSLTLKCMGIHCIFHMIHDGYRRIACSR